MSFISGTTALTICRLSKELPEDYLSRLAANSIGRLDDVKADPAMGWAGWRHFEAPVDETDAICGGHLCIQLVRAERKIPANLLKDACRKQELAYMQVHGSLPPSKERTRIKVEVVERNLMKMPPSVSSIPVAVDRKNKLCYIGSASTKAVDSIIMLLFKALEVEAIPLSPSEIMTHDAQVTKTMAPGFSIRDEDLPSLYIAGPKQEDLTPGRDFLTWLLYSQEETSTENNIAINGPLVFASPNSESKGAAESSVKKGGCPEIAAEARSALLVGKKLKRAKISIVREKLIWSGTFDADKFSFSGLALPEGEEMEQHARFEERMRHMMLLASDIQGLFLAYASTVHKQSATLMTTKLRDWAEHRESY